MKRRETIRYLTALITTALAAAAFATTATPAPPQVKITTLIAETEVMVWRCEDQRGVARTAVSISPWSLPKSQARRRRILALWQDRLSGCRKKLHEHDAALARLRRGLAGTPMAGSEAALEAAGRRYGVSPYFIAAVAFTESTAGHASCSNNRFNAWGLASCIGYWGSGSHKTYVPSFASWAEAYDFMGRYFTGRTTVTSGWWPWARTTYDIHGYAECSSCWAAKTAQHMASHFGVGPSVVY